MENDELLKRGEDLARRCEMKDCLTASGFLSPAEQQLLKNHPPLRRSRMVFRGGHEDSERAMAFFLPDYMEEDDLIEGEHISAVKLSAAFGTPTHRDYMGAVLAMGVSRDRVGDIIVDGDVAYILCQNSIKSHLLSMDKVGRWSVKAIEPELSEIPGRRLKCKSISFTLMSLRLDALCSGMFRISRSEAARQIKAGNVNLNYIQCLKPDAAVREGDVISLRGRGKGSFKEQCGSSRKGRTFVEAEIYE